MTLMLVICLLVLHSVVFVSYFPLQSISLSVSVRPCSGLSTFDKVAYTRMSLQRSASQDEKWERNYFIFEIGRYSCELFLPSTSGIISVIVSLGSQITLNSPLLTLKFLCAKYFFFRVLIKKLPYYIPYL